MDKYEGTVKIIKLDHKKPLNEVENFLSDFKDIKENEKLYVSLSKGLLTVKKLKKV